MKPTIMILTMAVAIITGCAHRDMSWVEADLSLRYFILAKDIAAIQNDFLKQCDQPRSEMDKSEFIQEILSADGKIKTYHSSVDYRAQNGISYVELSLWPVADQDYVFNNGHSTLTRNDIQNIKSGWNRIMTKYQITRSAQQVDSAEASTIAVPPSEPSGSPR